MKNGIVIRMKKTIQDILELPLILERITALMTTEKAQKNFATSTFIPQPLLSAHGVLVAEMMHVISGYGSIPLHPSLDTTMSEALMVKDGTLTIDQIVNILHDLKTVEQLKLFFAKVLVATPQIKAVIARLKSLPKMIQAIEKIIAPQKTIVNRASDNLFRIRSRMQAIESQMLTIIQSLVHTYQSYLTDNLYTIKNGRYVLPVSTSAKAQVEGVLHDVSATGLTSYIEPKHVLILGQEQQSLRMEEASEIIVILKHLTTVLATEVDAIKANNDTLAFIDELHAKATFGVKTQGYVAMCIDEPRITLKGARHPLIDPLVVIANDFNLTEKQAIIIISGPNAGGKTVAMKTVGLFIYMHQLGIPLPTSAPAELYYIEHIYADIGDGQSVLENLSTFAAHIQQLVPITNRVKPFDLVLIDELGTGTDPKEGEALARSLLMHLQAKRAFVIVSSHFPGLKTLAIQQPRMVNASLQFDEVHLKPTYHFVLGLPGKSYGLVMAKRYGLDPQVVAHAEHELAEQMQTQEHQTLSQLQTELETAETIKKNLLAQQQALKEAQRVVNEQQQKLDASQRDFDDNFEAKMKARLHVVQQDIDTVIKALANPDLKLHEAIALKQSLSPSHHTSQGDIENQSFKIDDYVRDRESGLIGRVVSITGKNLRMITNDGITVKLPFQRLQLESTPKPKQVKVITQFQNERAPSSLNIIGLRYEEAKVAIQQYYDKAMTSQLKQLKIIHGFGSGTLKKLVYDYFSHLPAVKKIQVGEGEQSGYGVTLIYL